MKPNNSFGIDEHIAARLTPIFPRTLQPPSGSQQFEIVPDRGWTVDGPATQLIHLVGSVERSAVIQEKRPLQCRLRDVGSRQRTVIKGHHHHPRVQLLKSLLLLTQLRQVLAARQSTQVAMKDHQQPFSVEIRQAVASTLNGR